MNKFLFLFAFAVVLTACENEKKQDKDASTSNEMNKTSEVDLELTEPEIDEIPSLRKCYTLKNGNTNAELNLELEDDLVTGSLVYSGDKTRSGSLTGEFSGDTLILAYKYKENNKTTVKEIVLLENKEDFTLQLGNADLVEKEGIKSIKDKSKIKFNGEIFSKLDCNQEEI